MGFKNCGICCMGFSLFAIVFLVIVGQVLQSNSEVIEIEKSKREAAWKNCYVGAAVYAGFFILAIGCYCKGRSSEKRGDEFQSLTHTVN